MGADRGRQLLGLRRRVQARHGQLRHGRARQPVDLLELEIVPTQRLEVHQQELLRRGLGRAAGTSGTARRPVGDRVELVGHEPEVGPEVRLAPNAQPEEVVHGPAQDLGVAIQLRHRHRPPALLDRDLRRAREAQLLRDHRLGQAQELPGLGDALADGLIRFHVVRADLSLTIIGIWGRYCQDGVFASRQCGSTTWRRSIE